MLVGHIPPTDPHGAALGVGMADTDGTVGADSARNFDKADMRGNGAFPGVVHDMAGTSDALANLSLMVDSMPIGVIVLDAELRAEVVNRAFYDFWKIDPRRAPAGSRFRDLMEASREADPFGSEEQAWQSHVAEREAEIRAGTAGSRQLPRKDGRTLIASLAPLPGGKPMVRIDNSATGQGRSIAL